MENKSIFEELADITKVMSDQATKSSIENEGDVTAPVATTSTGNEPAPVEPAAAPNEGDKPVEPADKPTPVEPTAPQVDVDAIVDNWDSGTQPAESSTANQPTVDFSDIAKVLGNAEIKTKEDLVKVVSDYKTKQEELEKRVNSIPTDLGKAIEIANLGGNYLEYLGVSQIDWSKEDPVSLYENYVIDRSADKDGNVDFDKVNEYLDNIPETEKEIRGKELQAQYMNYQLQTKASIEAAARNERAKFEGELQTALSKTDNIAGFKLSQAHKDELFRDISSGADLKPVSMEERVFLAFLKKHFKKVDEYRKTQIRNATLRETLAEATMPNIKPTAAPVAPPATKGYSFDDLIKDLDKKKF